MEECSWFGVSMAAPTSSVIFFPGTPAEWKQRLKPPHLLRAVTAPAEGTAAVFFQLYLPILAAPQLFQQMMIKTQIFSDIFPWMTWACHELLIGLHYFHLTPTILASWLSVNCRKVPRLSYEEHNSSMARVGEKITVFSRKPQVVLEN